MKTTSLHKKLLSVIALITLSQLVGCSGTAVKEMTDGTEGRYELSKKLDRSGISDRFEIVHVTFQKPESKFPLPPTASKAEGRLAYTETHPRHVKPAFEFSYHRDFKGQILDDGAKMKIGLDNPDEKLSICQQPTVQFFEREPLPNVGELNHKFKVELLEEGKSSFEELTKYQGKAMNNQLPAQKVVMAPEKNNVLAKTALVLLAPHVVYRAYASNQQFRDQVHANLVHFDDDVYFHRYKITALSRKHFLPNELIGYAVPTDDDDWEVEHESVHTFFVEADTPEKAMMGLCAR